MSLQPGWPVNLPFLGIGSSTPDAASTHKTGRSDNNCRQAATYLDLHINHRFVILFHNETTHIYANLYISAYLSWNCSVSAVTSTQWTTDFSIVSRLSLRLLLPPTQYVNGILSPELKMTEVRDSPPSQSNTNVKESKQITCNALFVISVIMCNLCVHGHACFLL